MILENRLQGNERVADGAECRRDSLNPVVEPVFLRRSRRLKSYQQLGAKVFASSPVPYRRKRLMFLLYLGLFLAGTLIALLRVPVSDWNTLWAEDGRIFLNDAYANSFAVNVFKPYEGYLHFVPRLVSEVLAFVVPAGLIAVAFTLAASAIWSATALVFFDFSRGHIPNGWLRAVLWLLVLLVPTASHEVAGNIANSHWFLMAAAMWALFARDRSWWQAVAAAIVVLVAVLSDPLIFILTPLLLVRLWSLRTLRAQLVSLAFIVGAIVQSLVVFSSSRNLPSSFPGVKIALIIAERNIVGSFLPPPIYKRVATSMGQYGFSILAALVFVMLLVLAILVFRRTFAPLVMLLWALVFAGVTTFYGWDIFDQLAFSNFLGILTRYLITPALAIFSLIVIMLSVFFQSIRSPLKCAGVQIIVAILALLLVVSWFRSFVYDFKVDIPDAGTQYQNQGCSAGQVKVVIPPGPAELWYAMIPCTAFR